MALAQTYYSGYGEFCAVWKEWNYVLNSAGRPDVAARRADLHVQACHAEGLIEASLLKMAAERHMPIELAAELGSLRQAFQILRERIQENRPISYGWSAHPDYLEFKRLATLVGNLLATRSGRLPSAAEAYRSFVEITDNSHEARWKAAGR